MKEDGKIEEIGVEDCREKEQNGQGKRERDNGKNNNYKVPKEILELDSMNKMKDN